MGHEQEQDQTEVSETARAVVRAFQVAVRETLIDHKLRGLPVVGSENGQVKWIPAEEIVIPPEPSNN